MADREVTVATILTAEDRASRVIATAERNMVESSRRTGSAISDVEVRTARTTGQVINFDRAMRTAGSSVRVLAYPLAAELSPALGTTASRMASVVAGAAIMPSRLLAIGAAATGLAGILVGTLVSAWMRNREEVEKWNKAVRESDFGTLRTEAAKTAAEIGVLTEGLERLRRARDQGVTPQATAPRGATAPLTPGIPAPRYGQQYAGLLAVREGQREAALTTFRGQVSAAGRAELNQALIDDALAVQRMQDASADQATTLRRSQAGIFDFRLPAREQAYRESLRAAAELRRAGQHAAADRVEAAAQQRRQFDVGAAWAASHGWTSMLEDPAAAAMPISTARSAFGLEADTTALAHGQRWADSFREGYALLEDPAAAAMPAGTARALFGIEGRQQEIELTRELIALDQDRIDILAQTPALSLQQRDALTEMVALEREALRLREADLQIQEAKTPNDEKIAKLRRAQVELEEGMLRAQRAIARQEREDPVSGMLAGIREIEEEWAGAGRAMTNITKQTAGDIQSALASALRGDLVGKDFAKALVGSIQRTITDEMARQITSRLFTGARSLFGGAVPGFFNLTGGAPAAGGPPIDVSNAPVQTLASLQQQGYQLVGGAGGRTLAMPYTQPSSGFNLGQYRFPFPAALGGTPTVTAGGVTYTGADAGYAAAELGAVGAPYQTSSTANIGQAAGSVVALAAAAYGIYSAYEAGSRGTDQAAATQSSAITGATSGLLVASIFGGAAGFGIFAAAAIAGHFAAEEASDRKKKIARRQARHEQANDILGQIQATLNNDSLSLDEMLATRVLAKGEFLGGPIRLDFSHGSPRRIADMREVPGPTTGGLLLALAQGRHPGLADLLRARGYSAEDINVERLVLGGGDKRGWINSAGELAASIPDLSAYLQSVYARLQDLDERDRLERSVPFGYVERGSGVTRTTYRAFGRLGDLEPGTQDIFVSRDVYRQMGLDDSQIERVIQTLNTWTVKRDMITDLNATRFLEAFR